MHRIHCRRLREFAREEAAALLVFQRSDRPWQLPFAAAVASGMPVAAGAYFELPSAGALGAVRSEEHTSELQSLMRISYAVFCLKKKSTINTRHDILRPA